MTPPTRILTSRRDDRQYVLDVLSDYHHILSKLDPDDFRDVQETLADSLLSLAEYVIKHL